MRNKRKAHGNLIENFQEKALKLELFQQEQLDAGNVRFKIIFLFRFYIIILICLHFQPLLPNSSDTEINSTFKKVISSKKALNLEKLYKKKSKKPKKIKSKRDDDNYIPYQSSDKHTEDGLAINSFEQQARNAEFSITNTAEEVKYKPGLKKWDRIKKKMVSVENPKNNKIRTESGIWIPATYKTGRYAEWKEKTKADELIQQEIGTECKLDTIRNIFQINVICTFSCES